jgi:hypothetical protein
MFNITSELFGRRNAADPVEPAPNSRVEPGDGVSKNAGSSRRIARDRLERGRAWRP